MGMAIIIEGITRCTLCDTVLDANKPYVGFPHFIHDMQHELWRFSDSGMHKECFQNWPHAQEFRVLFDELWPILAPRHPRKILADGSILALLRAILLRPLLTRRRRGGCCLLPASLETLAQQAKTPESL